MKSVVGIDLEGRYRSSLALLGRLGFSMEETCLLHVSEPMSSTVPFSAYGLLVETDEVMNEIRESGKRALEAARFQAADLLLRPSTSMVEGFPIRCLTDFADQVRADLVSVTSTVTGTIESVLGGSVARGLVLSAKQSLLVAREDVPSEGPIRAVFAIDHSQYCEQCIDQLIRFRPRGIAHLTVLTIHCAKHHAFPHVGSGPKVDPDKAFDHLTASGGAVAERLSEGGIPSESLVAPGGIEETIHRVMLEQRADLLIVCSQGHSFLDRVMVGSTSLHEVLHERYPVLLLRHV
ncbi:MAG: universal stress protein [Fimbriimonas sp.]|nr:universal stress protein [Fimbriimonas sp.]